MVRLYYCVLKQLLHQDKFAVGNRVCRNRQFVSLRGALCLNRLSHPWMTHLGDQAGRFHIYSATS
jgi:hypothetical protein